MIAKLTVQRGVGGVACFATSPDPRGAKEVTVFGYTYYTPQHPKHFQDVPARAHAHLSTVASSPAEGPRSQKRNDYLRLRDRELGSQRSISRRWRPSRAPDFATPLACYYAPAPEQSANKERCHGR